MKASFHSFSLVSILSFTVAAGSTLGCTANSGSPADPGVAAPGPSGAPAPAALPPGISLRVLPSRGSAGEIFVEASYSGGAGRVMELQIKHSPELVYLGATKGTALEAASKDFIVQNKAPDVVRTVALSGGNVNPIGSGSLVTYRFAPQGSGPYRVEVLTASPIFAPPEANVGLHVSEPIDVHF